ncbi:MAG: hypothetical protein Q7Q73_04200 [Verrucomicrobiota bacterium JB024]|nr:hypothetical protein [Verrucomicrobiota bacterium JB024]
MKRSLLISFVSAAALTASTYASTVDFSAYSTPTTLGTSVVVGSGVSSAVLQDANGDTEFTYYQGFGGGTGNTATYSGVVLGSGGSSNYLQMQAVKNDGGGQPWGQVSTTNAFNTALSGQAMSWNSTFTISQIGTNGSLKTGLFAYSAMGSAGNYTLAQDQQTPGSAIGLSVVFQSNSELQIMRTNSDGSREFWSGSSWGGSLGTYTWAEDVGYSVTLTADSTTDILTLEVVRLDTDTVVASAQTDLADQNASAYDGGLRFSTGNLESNSSSGWTLDLDSVSANVIPEPAEYSLMLGAVIVLGAWLRRRR